MGLQREAQRLLIVDWALNGVKATKSFTSSIVANSAPTTSGSSLQGTSSTDGNGHHHAVARQCHPVGSPKAHTPIQPQRRSTSNTANWYFRCPGPRPSFTPTGQQPTRQVPHSYLLTHSVTDVDQRISIQRSRKIAGSCPDKFRPLTYRRVAETRSTVRDEESSKLRHHVNFQLPWSAESDWADPARTCTSPA